MDKNTLPNHLRNEFQNIGNSLNSIITEDARDILGEPWITQLSAVRDEINTTLASFPPTEQVPAANEAHWSLMSLHRTLLGVQNMINFIRGSLGEAKQKVGQARASVTAEFEKKITDGLLLNKDVAEGLVLKAREEAELAGFNKGRLLGDRRAGLTLAGIPAEVAAKAPDAALLGEQKDFDQLVADAKARWEKLSGIGITLQTGSALHLPFEKEEGFNSQFELLSSVAGKGKTQNTAATPPATPAGRANPMLGGANTPAAETKKEPAKTRIAF